MEENEERRGGGEEREEEYKYGKEMNAFHFCTT